MTNPLTIDLADLSDQDLERISRLTSGEVSADGMVAIRLQAVPPTPDVVEDTAA